MTAQGSERPPMLFVTLQIVAYCTVTRWFCLASEVVILAVFHQRRRNEDGWALYGNCMSLNWRKILKT
jgi:hypothetical protein